MAATEQRCIQCGWEPDAAGCMCGPSHVGEPTFGPDPDECRDDGDGYCLTHEGGVFFSFEEDCSVVYAAAGLAAGWYRS